MKGREKEKERTTTKAAGIYRCTINANSLKGQTALHCLANKGVRYPIFVIVLDRRSPGSQRYHIVVQLQSHRYLHVRQEAGSTFSQC